MRYKDVHERMELLYPYFVYDFGFGSSTTAQFKRVDVFPVTDGENTYWLIPLVVALDTRYVPWSSSPDLSSSFMLKLVGYALVDTYNGSVQVIVTGDDYFSEIFLNQYRDIGATREIPEWLSDQIKYPEEMFVWTISKFNIYHVTDPKTFTRPITVSVVAPSFDRPLHSPVAVAAVAPFGMVMLLVPRVTMPATPRTMA